MDESPQQAVPATVEKQGISFPKIEKYLIFFGVLILGFILGFASKTFLLPQKDSPLVATKPAFDESKLPISMSLLTNPVVYEWRGGVKGKMTKKDEHTFTLTNDQGQSITISDTTISGDKFNTLFFDTIKDKTKPSSASAVLLKDIPLNSILEGDFFVFKNGPNIPIGGMFNRK